MSHISAWQQAPAAPEFLSTQEGLTDTDVTRARQVMRLLLNGWSLDRHEDCNGVLSLVITPTIDHDDAPAFALHLADGLIQCGVVLNDTYAVVGRHARIEYAVRAAAEFLRARRLLAA